MTITHTEAAWDRLYEALLDLEAELGANPLGASRISVLAADLREVLTVADHALAAATRRAKTPKAVECEASQSGGEAVTPTPNSQRGAQ